MTFEATPPAASAGGAALVGPPVRAPLPWRGFLIDCLLAGLLLVGLSLLFIVPIVMLHMAPLAAAGKTVGSSPDLSGALPAITAGAILATLCTAGLMWWLRGRALPDSLPRMALLPACGLALAAGVIIQLGMQVLTWLLAQSGAGPDPRNAEPVMALLRTVPWLAWLLVVVVGPFAEELLMRHVLLRRFAVAGHAGIGLVLTSAAFALLHEPAPGDAGLAAWIGGLALYTGMGAAFGLVYLRTGRFRAAFLAHAACNAMALVLASYSAS